MFAEVSDVAPGWFGVLLQGGSFALIVFLVAYLFPRQRREIAAERDAERQGFVAEIKAQRSEFLAAVKEMTAAFRAETMAERSACEKHFATLAEAMGKGNETSVAAIRTMFEQQQAHSERNRQWIEMMKEEIAKREVKK